MIYTTKEDGKTILWGMTTDDKDDAYETVTDKNDVVIFRQVDMGKDFVYNAGDWYEFATSGGGSGGGGGGGGVLTVNVDPSTRACDKTAKEIADALNTQVVRFKATITQEGATNVLYALVESVASNGVLYGITYSDIKGNFPYDGFESPAYSANDYPIMKES